MAALPGKTVALGSPQSPTHKIDPIQLADWMTEYEALAGSGGVSYIDGSLSALNARSGTSDGEFALVVSDGSDAGVYERISGTWTKKASLPSIYGESIAADAAAASAAAASDSEIAVAASEAAAAASEIAAATSETNAAASEAAAAASAAQAALFDGPRFDNITDLGGDTFLTYTAGQDGTVAAGTIIRVSGQFVEVADSGAVDQHGITTGGVKWYEAGPNFSTRARMVAAKARMDAAGDTVAVGTVWFDDLGQYRFLDDGNTDITGMTGWVLAVENGADVTETAASRKNDLAQILIFSGLDLTIDRVNSLVKWPYLRIEREGLAQEFAGLAAAPGYVDLPLSTDNARIHYYVDLAEANAADRIKSATSSMPAISSTIIYLGSSSFGKLSLYRDLPILDTTEEDRIVAIEDGLEYNATKAGLTARQTRFVSFETSPDRLAHFREPYAMAGTGKIFEAAPVVEGQTVQTPGNGIVGLTHMASGGRGVEIAGINTFHIFAGYGATFHGTTDNYAAITGGGYVVAKRRAAVRYLQTDATVTYSTISEPVPDRHIVIGGQSHGNLTYLGGLGGLSRALHDSTLDSHISANLGFTNVSEGGVGVLVGPSVGWWDVASDLPSTLLDAKTALIDAAVSGGWPLPAMFTFDCGDADRGAFDVTNPQTMLPYTVPDLALYVGKVLDEIRAHCAVDALCMMTVYHGVNSGAANSGANSDAYCTASREAYLIAAASRPWVHVTESKAHRDRPLGDVHLTPLGYYKHAYNTGRQYGNIVNSVASPLPQVSSVTYDNTNPGGRSCLVTFSAPAGQSLVMPETTHIGNRVPGPFPFGLGLIGQGGDALNDLQTIEWAEVVSANQIRLYVDDASDVRNAHLITVAGRLEDAHAGNFVRDDSIEASLGRGVQPVRFGPINVMTP